MINLIANITKAVITAPIDITGGVLKGIGDAAEDIMDRIDGTK